MKHSLEEMVQRDHFFCIVDEVDSILIDEARTPLVISGATEDKSDQYFVCNKFIKELDKQDYELDEKDKNVMLSEKGIDKIEKLSQTYGILKNNNFYDPKNINFVHHINQALKANLLFLKTPTTLLEIIRYKLLMSKLVGCLTGEDFLMGYIKL